MKFRIARGIAHKTFAGCTPSDDFYECISGVYYPRDLTLLELKARKVDLGKGDQKFRRKFEPATTSEYSTMEEIRLMNLAEEEMAKLPRMEHTYLKPFFEV